MRCVVFLLFRAFADERVQVLRTRLRQPLVNGKVKYTGLVQTLRLVIAEEGARSLYGGLSAHLMRVIPEKELAMPGELSPGEYEVVAQIMSVSTLERVSRRGDFKFTEEEGRWSDLATICRQAKGPWLLDFI